MRAEIFPWAGLYSVFVHKRVDHRFIIIFALLIVSAFFTIINSFHHSNQGLLIYEVVRSLFAYLNVTIIYYAILNSSSAELDRIISYSRIVFLSLTALSLLQYINAIPGLDPLIKYFVTRAKAGSYEGFRGVTLMSSEPSRAAIEYMFLYLVYIFNSGFGPTKRFIADIVMSAVVVLLIKSATGFVYLLIYWFTQRPKFSVILLFFLPLLLLMGENSNRIITILQSVLASNDVSTIFYYIIDQAGFRFVSVYSAYYSVFDNPLGCGVGNWMQSSFLAMQNNPISVESFSMYREGGYSPQRPTSFFANIALDLGLLGLTIGIILILKMRYISLLKVKNFTTAMAMWLIFIFIVGSVGEPVPWICFAIVYRMYYNKKSSTCA